MKRILFAILTALAFIAPGTSRAQSVTTISADRFIGGTFSGTGLITNTVASGYAATFMGGNVGIGNTAPTALLSLGTAGSNTLPTNTKLWISGIGGSSDTAMLSRISIGVDNNQDYGAYIGGMYTIGNKVITQLGTRIGGVDYPSMYLNLGNVGIGTTSPQTALSLASNGVISFEASAGVTDTGISRVSPGIVAVGNGTQGNTSGTVQATTFTGALNGNASTATTAGTVTTAAQPNITSVGTLTGLTVDPGGITTSYATFGNTNKAIFYEDASTMWIAGAAAAASPGIGMSRTNGTLNLLYHTGQIGASISNAGVFDTAIAQSIGGYLTISATAPTIASGFCATPTITANNTAAFKITTGGSCAGSSSGTVTMPGAANGWVCNPQYLNAPGTVQVVQSAFTTTSVSVANYTLSTGVLTNLASGTQILFQCTAF